MQNRLFKILVSVVGAILLLSACFGEADRKLFIDAYEPNNLIAECIELSLQSPESIKTSEGFTATVEVTNTCDRIIEIGYGAGGDLLITQIDGKVLWQHYQGGVTPTVLSIQILEAGESFESAVYTWNGQDWQNKILAAGDYQAVVMFNIINIVNAELESSGNLESVKSFKITN